MNRQKKTWAVSRFFSFLFSPMKIIFFILMNVCLIATLVSIGLEAVLWGILILPCIDVIVFLIFTQKTSKSFEQEKCVLTFTDEVILRRTILSRARYVRVKYTVLEVEDVVFTQNFIEKIFDVGRVSFSGRYLFDAGKHQDRIRERHRFKIRGIKNFSKFKNEFKYKV